MSFVWYWPNNCSIMKKANRMKKKKISKRTPKGVKYPKAVTADGQFVNAIDIDKSSEIWNGMRFFSPGFEGDDEEEMLFIQRRHKNGVTKFFRHRPGYWGERNEPDRYLHNYAESRIKQRYEESLISGIFPVYYYKIKKCPYSAICKLKTSLNCDGEPKAVSTELNLRDLYDTCEIEKGADKYIADLLLTNSKDDSVQPMLMEIYVSHKCSTEKTNSGYRIIEIKIDSEEDAEMPIIESAGKIIEDYVFMHPENQKDTPPIYFHGFQRDAPFNDFIKVVQLLLTKKDTELIADCRIVECKDAEKDISENHFFSISVPLKELKGEDLYEIGMAKAFDLGINVRDCTLCKRYKIPTKQENMIHSRSCRLINSIYNYKDNKGKEIPIHNPYVCWLPYKCLLNKNQIWDKSKQAISCRTFSIDKERISNLVSLLNSKIHYLWVDTTLRPAKSEIISSSFNTQVEEKKLPDDSKTHKPIRKLLAPHECSYCPNQRINCSHCLGSEFIDGQPFFICDYQEPQ